LKPAFLRCCTAVAALLLAPLLGGCSTLDYYAQLASGQVQLLSKREPIAQLLADPQTDAKLKARLAQAQQARAFASDRLDLPRNRSYTLYADLGRPYVMWNVFAAPEFSLKPVLNCLPIAGCVAYRGYYHRADAERRAAALRAAGDDTDVEGVPAYSTLGWFDDPILNTMLRWDDDTLDSTIFHELAHQQLYLKGDTAFNESFATFVQREGLREWRAARGRPAGDDDGTCRDDQFVALILATRRQLEALYASGQPVELMRQRKQALFDALRADYRQLRDGSWRGYAGYDAWMNAPLNNARLLPFGLYHRWVPAFATLFRASHEDWPAFYAAARRLSEAPAAQREARLQQLAATPRP
jgi:predicted aminopeptidase